MQRLELVEKIVKKLKLTKTFLLKNSNILRKQEFAKKNKLFIKKYNFLVFKISKFYFYFGYEVSTLIKN